MERSIGISVGGIVELDVLAVGHFSIDYERRKMVFGSTVSTLHLVPLATRAPFPTVRTEIDGQPVKLLLDSGTWEVLVFRDRLRLPPEQLRLDRTAVVSTVGGGTRLVWTRAVVTIGSVSLGRHNVAVADAGAAPDFDGLLGFARMGFHRVVFDFDNGMFGWD